MTAPDFGLAFDRLLAETQATRARAATADAVTQQSGYVRAPHPLCQGSRCQAPALTGAAEQARALAAALMDRYDQEREQAMTMVTPQTAAQPCQSLWCEEGGHSFSERDPGMRVVSIEGTDETGAPVADSRTMCGGCAPRVNVRRTRPAAAPGQPPLPMPAAPSWPDAYEAPAPDTAARL